MEKMEKLYLVVYTQYTKANTLKGYRKDIKLSYIWAVDKETALSNWRAGVMQQKSDGTLVDWRIEGVFLKVAY